MSLTTSADAFEALVGTTFRVVGPWVPDPADETDDLVEAAPTPDAGPPVTLTLVRVERVGGGGPFEQFRVMFRGPSAAPLDQGTFVLDPPPAGLDALFLVPNADHGDERVYSASVSIRRPPTERVGP